ncbi:putative NADPH-dependent methylglyoxal reductase GRP2 [Yarrowia sp. C11]|nr:putative NADPH-dependent methylglyoxal reductase GRP2 [Yarrowia sp. C11]KAG5364612.1 putative NADPH-dependent methylglyoxal reductase GRP2 [Yarrowia sp. E02]
MSILVTGATGFIAAHCIDQLLKSGHSVIGTIRSPQKGAALEAVFADAVANKKLILETVSDIRSAEEFDQLFDKHPEIGKVLHTASPFHFNIKDPIKDMLEPAVEGTNTVLQSVLKHAPQVTKVVVTSSFVSMLTADDMFDPSVVVDEKSWNRITWEQGAGNVEFLTYFASKKFAEKAAWDFVENEKPFFQLTTVNPSLVFGPSVTKPDLKSLNTSNADIVTHALEVQDGDEGVGQYNSFCVDVRDVAKGHVVALDDKTNGKRLMLCSDKFCSQRLLNYINEDFPELKGKIAVGNPAQVDEIEAKTFNFDNSETKKLLGFEFTPLRETIKDFVAQWLEAKKGN